MKKLIAWILGALSLLLLVGCDMPLTPVRPPEQTFEDTNTEAFSRLFNDASYKEITIHITRANFDLLDQHMINHHQKFGDYRSDIYVEARFEFSDDQGTFEVDQVGLRTRGNLSRTRIQNSDGTLNLSHFKISFKTDLGLIELAHHSKRTVFELEEIDMKYNRNQDETYLNEKFSMDLFRAYDVYAQHVTFANVFVEIDDMRTNYGIYTLFEPIDKKFMQRRLVKEASDGDLYKVLWQQFGPANLTDNYDSLAIGIRDVSRNYRPSYDLKNNKKTSDHQPLKDFIQALNTLEGSAFVNYIETHFEADMFLRYLAINVLLGNPDDYRSMGNNYYLYLNPITEKWMVIPYDFDHGLGQGWHPWRDDHPWSVGLDIYQWQNLTFFNNQEQLHPLSDKILALPMYQDIYEMHLMNLLHDPLLFSYDKFLDTYEKQRALYDESLIDNPFNQPRFGLRNSAWYFQEKTEDVLNQLGQN